MNICIGQIVNQSYVCLFYRPNQRHSLYLHFSLFLKRNGPSITFLDDVSDIVLVDIMVKVQYRLQLAQQERHQFLHVVISLITFL